VISRRNHHSLLISHFISTVIHLISSILLYLSWHFAKDQCEETSIFLTNLQAILIAIYALTVVVKVAVLIKHFCHIRVPAKYITIITTIIAAKQFLLAVICEVFLEASTMVPRSGCPAIRETVGSSHPLFVTPLHISQTGERWKYVSVPR
ncbi:hypothetical protein GCK32_020643, partial [Trichostrongylus colubriformis]